MKSSAQRKSEPPSWMEDLKGLDSRCWNLVKEIVASGNSIDAETIQFANEDIVEISNQLAIAPISQLTRCQYIELLDISLKWKAFEHRYNLDIAEFDIPQDEHEFDLTERALPRKYISGKVVKKSAEKTISVEFDRTSRDSRTGKVLKKTSKILAHDEHDQAQVGDRVLLRETRPLSKRKRHTIVGIDPKLY